jgi:RsiW-degrading membrane proteinase PrsW (M82 family)
LTDFKVSYLFSDVLKRRSRADIDTYLNCGCIRTTPEITDVSTEWPRPWFFVRILLFGLLTTLGFGFGTAWFGNLKMVPGLIIVDAFFVPLTCVTIFFELNVPRNISFYQVTKFVVYGGVVSLLISLLLYQTTAIQHTFLGATSAGLVEETAKVLACAVLLRGAQQYKWILNGILIGAAVGAGFAGFESAGYAYESIIHRDVTRVLVALTMRAIFAPFTHVVWTASVVGALWRVKQDRPFHVSMFGERGFLRVLAFVIMLHMLWNSGLLWSMPLKGAALVKSELLLWSVSFVGSWYLVLLLVQEGLRQVAVVKGTSTAEVNEGSMAATKCSECGHNISDKAAACPQCGCFVAAAVESTKSDATSPPLPPGVNYRGTRDQVPRSGLVYPRNPPLTPHLCWLNLSGLGIAQMMHGQAAKGIVQFLAIFLAVVIGAVAGGDVGMDFGFLGVTIASIVDAYMVGKALQCGRPVGKWECFPKS